MINVSLVDGHPNTETSPNTALTSIMSFQSITNWWSPRSGAATTATFESSMGQQSKKLRGLIEKKYVSKDKQMEKLRIRINQERKTNRRGSSHGDVCPMCTAETVYL